MTLPRCQHEGDWIGTASRVGATPIDAIEPWRPGKSDDPFSSTAYHGRLATRSPCPSRRLSDV